MQTDKIYNLVGQIYDAVSEPDQWGSFLDNLAKAMGGHAARMRMLDKRKSSYNLVAGIGHDDSFDALYTEHFSKVDVLNPPLNRSVPGVIFNSDEVVPYSELKHTEFYNDFFRRYDILYGIGGNIAKSDDFIARIGIHRSRSQGPYSKQNIHLLKQLMPHLMRAFKLGTHFHELQSKVVGMEHALYSSSTPLLLIDEVEKVAFVSRQAEATLASNNGLSVQKNHIKLSQASEQQQLQQLISLAVATGKHQGMGSGGALRISAEDGEQHYNLIVTPYPAAAASHLGLNSRICAAVFIHDTRQRDTLPAELLKTLYGLTPSEIRLAEAIMEGLTPAEAAERFGVSVNTTRTQLRALFAKTDTQRQPELVRLFSGLPLTA